MAHLECAISTAVIDVHNLRRHAKAIQDGGEAAVKLRKHLLLVVCGYDDRERPRDRTF
jgi:hypothetical protein